MIHRPKQKRNNILMGFKGKEIQYYYTPVNASLLHYTEVNIFSPYMFHHKTTANLSLRKRLFCPRGKGWFVSLFQLLVLVHVLRLLKINRILDLGHSRLYSGKKL